MLSSKVLGALEVDITKLDSPGTSTSLCFQVLYPCHGDTGSNGSRLDTDNSTMIV